LRRLSLKTKLLIYEYKEKYPQASAESIAELFVLKIRLVELLFKKGEIEVPSKMNKEHGQKKDKIYGGKGLLPGRGKSSFYKGISKEKRPMLRREV
jgi:hypothetical protein